MSAAFAWTKIDRGAGEEDVMSFANVLLPPRKDVINGRIRKSMKLGRYEMAEVTSAERVLAEGERVLDIGAGLGFLSARLAASAQVAEVLAVEANPGLIELIEETFELNDVSGKAHTLNALLSPGEDAPDALPFYIRDNFWASSLSAGDRAYADEVMVPTRPLAEVVETFDPTMIVCDIEGGETTLFEGFDARNVRQIVIEMHPGVYGQEGVAQVIGCLLKAGFSPDLDAPRRGHVLTFLRHAGA